MSLEITLLSMLLMSFLGIAAVVVMQRRSLESNERLAAALERAHQLYAKDVRELLERVLMLKGMHPHHASPEQFTPAGHSWQVHEELKQMPVEAPDVGSDDVIAERQMMEDLREWALHERQETMAENVNASLDRPVPPEGS